MPEKSLWAGGGDQSAGARPLYGEADQGIPL